MFLVVFDFSPPEYEDILKNVHLTNLEKEILIRKINGEADIDIAMELDKCRKTIQSKKKKMYVKIIKYLQKKR